MQHQAHSHALSLVCIAAPADASSLARWETYVLPLQQTGFLSVWSERSLLPGEERWTAWAAHLDQAEVVVLLLSADFFASEECRTLMSRALQRRQEGAAQIIPLLVRPVLWRESPLGTLACLPANEVPVLSWENQDEGWLACVLGLQQFLGYSFSRAQESPPDKRDHSDRGRLLRWLQRDYQRDLDESLERLFWLELGLTEQPDAVRNAIHLLQRRPDRSERALPAGTSILNAYDQAAEVLLILGDPGAGKSTLLRDLALHLIRRAQKDEAHPLPVILPLSSWAAKKPPLAEWIVEQLTRIYDVPHKLGQLWADSGQILPLLDGLDEMEANARPLCITAINTYRQAHITPLVVCSRTAEYQTASVHQRFLLQNAVIVQPLLPEQIEQSVLQGGSTLTGLREAMKNSQELCDLARTPLMLSVLVLAYHDVTITDLPRQQATLECQVWTDYVERMVREKGVERQGRQDVPVKRYPLQQTRSSLGWLAQQMRAHNQALFYGEHLQESWLPSLQQRAVGWLADRLPVILLGVCASLLLFLFLGGSLTAIAMGPAELCQAGLIGGFLGWYLRADQHKRATVKGQQPCWISVLSVQGLYLLRAGSFAILIAFSCGLNLNESPNGPLYGLSDWARDGIIFSSSLLVSAWLLQVVCSHLSSLPSLAQHTPRRWEQISGWLRMTSTRRALWTAVTLGICMAMSAALSTALSYGPSAWLNDGLLNGFNTGLGIGPIYALSSGGAIYLVDNILDRQIGTIRLAEQVSWTWHPLLSSRHIRAGFIVALASLSFFGLLNGLNSALWAGLLDGLNNGLLDGLSYGLSYGLLIGLFNGLVAGLSYGLVAGLSFWLLLGVYQGMTQEHLEDRDRRRFNQGIHYSLRNGLLLSLLGAGIIAGMGVLTVGLIQGLNELSNGSNGLSRGSNGLSNGLSNSWLFLLCGWFVIWTATGGLTILRHYILRLRLASSHTFPLHARHFLDDVTARVLLRRQGGGYGFVHRRLLDYFADQALMLANAPEAPHQTSSVPQTQEGSDFVVNVVDRSTSVKSR